MGREAPSYGWFIGLYTWLVFLVRGVEGEIWGHPSHASAEPPMVIIGCGIIGMLTALFVAVHRGNGSSITIVEKESEPFTGASGHANGQLGDFDVKPEVESLAKLSWELYQLLAAKCEGRTHWGHRDTDIFHLCYTSVTDNAESASKPTHSLPAWLNLPEGMGFTSLSGHEHAARINPIEFCKLWLECCEAFGVRILLNTTVTKVHDVQNGALEKITVAQGQNSREIPCQSLVLAAGAWSEIVLNELFPKSRIHIPSDHESSSGNYFIMRIPRWEHTNVGQRCAQVFLPDGINLSSRSDGAFFVGGPLSASEAISENTSDIQPQLEYIHKMEEAVAKLLAVPFETTHIARAYRPTLKCGRPIISQIALSDLFDTDGSGGHGERPFERGRGVFVNVGHGWDGITLALGSAKVLCELIEKDRASSADISGLAFP